MDLDYLTILILHSQTLIKFLQIILQLFEVYVAIYNKLTFFYYQIHSFLSLWYLFCKKVNKIKEFYGDVLNMFSL